MSLTPDQLEEIRMAWAIEADSLGIELLRENAPDVLKKISDPIVLSPETRTAGRPGPTKIQLVKEAVADYLSEVWTTITEPYAVELRKLVCVELKYCERRLNDDGIIIATTIADSIAGWYMKNPLPVTTMTVYALKTGVFNKLCKCDEKK